MWSDLLGAIGGLKLNPTAFKRSCDDKTAGGSLVSARRCTCRAQTAFALQPLLTLTSLQQLPVFGRRSRLFQEGDRWGFIPTGLKQFRQWTSHTLAASQTFLLPFSFISMTGLFSPSVSLNQWVCSKWIGLPLWFLWPRWPWWLLWLQRCLLL